MLKLIYQWIQDIAFYLLIVTAALEVLPGEGYQKYIRFFTGMVLLLLFAAPLLRLSGLEGSFAEKYRDKRFEQESREAERKIRYFDTEDLFHFFPEEYKEDSGESNIEVGEIRIENELEGFSE